MSEETVKGGPQVCDRRGRFGFDIAGVFELVEELNEGSAKPKVQVIDVDGLVERVGAGSQRRGDAVALRVGHLSDIHKELLDGLRAGAHAFAAGIDGASSLA